MATNTAASRPGPGQAAQSNTAYWLVAIGAFFEMVGASVLLSGLSILTAPIVADLYTDEAGRPANGGQAAFLLYFTLMTFSIVIPLIFWSGKLYAKYGARIMLSVGGLTMTAGLCLFGIAHSSIVFYFAGIIIGLGYGLSLAVIPPSLVNSWFFQKKGLVLGIVLSGTGVGGLVWAMLGPSLSASMGWRTVVFIMAASLAACTVLPALFLIKNTPADLRPPRAPYGADQPAAVATESADPAARAARSPLAPPSGQLPGLTFAQAIRSSAFWMAAVGFFLFGAVVALTQVLSIVFKTAAYANPLLPVAKQPADQVAFYSTLFVVWLVFLVAWKPLLGILNDRMGTIGMMIFSVTLMGLAIVYLPSMVHGQPVWVMYLAMIFMSCGISNATVTPPLVVAQAVGAREYPKIFSTAVACYYAGTALGAPLWGALGNMRRYDIGMYASPFLLAAFVILCMLSIRRGRAAQVAAADVTPAAVAP